MSITYKKNTAKGFDAELAKLIEDYNNGMPVLNVESLTVRNSDGKDVVLNGTELLKHKNFEYYQDQFFMLVKKASELDPSWYNRAKPDLQNELTQLKNKAKDFKVLLNINEDELRLLEIKLMGNAEWVKHHLAEAGTGVLDGAAGGLKSLGNILLHPQRTARDLAYFATHKQEAWDSAKAALESRPLYYAGRFFGGLGTSIATGAATGFLTGHEQMVTQPIDHVHLHPMPNPDTLSLVSVNGNPVLATVTMTHTINQPVMAAASGVTLASQASAAGVDFQSNNDKLSSMPSAFSKKPASSDTNVVPLVALNC
ncbi:MAG: hypothetical protein NTU49_00235 [Gammaproteobacteria bacterium]|nr:hypothetical protein [Gammaproteobacteria bacterium]